MFKDGVMYWGRLKTDKTDHKLVEYDDMSNKFVMIETNTSHSFEEFIDIEEVMGLPVMTPDCI